MNARMESPYWETTCVVRVRAENQADARKKLTAFVQLNHKEYGDPVYYVSWAEPYPADPPSYEIEETNA